MTPEQTIGHYHITARIGAGGMGEVYRARDTKLGREVAIKVLPPAFAEDAGRMARFEREARVLASLNHPNIAQIYGVEEHALVMELVDGESPKGPMPFEDAWKIAMQIADALEYAHDKGVVHRDLKPANVKVTPDGMVKLLDFGLAKAYSDQPDAASGDPSLSPTVTLGATVAGTIMGTAAYMSPEQARGKPVDKRADIWSWGVVLYELLTGEQMFQGEDAAETLAAVIHKQPDVEKAPPQVRTLLRRCLEKDPKKRLRDISVAQELLEKTPQAEARATSKLPWMAAAGVLVVAAAMGVGWWRASRPIEHKLVRLDVDLGSDVSLVPPTDTGSSVILSPDGTHLAYLATTGKEPTRLFIRPLDQPDATATALPGTEGARGAFFSPDGQWIGFTDGGNLNKISATGGAVVPLADLPTFGASWAEDGSIVVGGRKGLLRIPAGGGPESVLEGLGSGDSRLVLPRILPGGKTLLFTRSASTAPRNIEVLSLADRRRTILPQAGQSPHYLPASDHDGYLVYNNQATLFAVPFDLDKLETHGMAVPILHDVAYHPGSGAGQFALSASGTLVYRRGGAGGEPAMSTIDWVDPAGKRQPLLAKPGAYLGLNFSPDGKRLAIRRLDSSGPAIWVYDLERDIPTRLAARLGAHPIWSPDGKYVVFGSLGGVWWMRGDGAGQPQRLLRSQEPGVPFSFTSKGKRLAYEEDNPQPQIWTVPIEESDAGLKAGTPELFLKDQSSDMSPMFSPDGHWLAYRSNASGDYEFHVRPFPPPASGQGGQWQISSGGAGAGNLYGLAWAPKRQEFYYQSGDQIMAVDYTVQGDTFVPGKARVWISKIGGTQWDLAPDGKRIAVITPVRSGEAPKADHEVVFLLNFLDYLKQQVPFKQ